MQLGARIYFALGASVFLTVLTAQYLALFGLVKLAARVIQHTAIAAYSAAHNWEYFIVRFGSGKFKLLLGLLFIIGSSYDRSQ